MMSCSRKFQPLATSTPNSKSETESAVYPSVNKHVTEDKGTIWSNEIQLSAGKTVNRRVLSPGCLLTEDEKLFLFNICNGRPVT